MGVRVTVTPQKRTTTQKKTPVQEKWAESEGTISRLAAAAKPQFPRRGIPRILELDYYEEDFAMSSTTTNVTTASSSGSLEEQVKTLQDQVDRLQLEKTESERKHAKQLEEQQIEIEELKRQLLTQKELVEPGNSLSQIRREMEELKVIINLQDELQASKQVIQQQKHQIGLLTATATSEEGVTTSTLSEDSITNKKTDNEEDDESSLLVWKQKYRDLQHKHSKLQIDRAYGEFRLRDRITNDSLKYHRRLIHWKKQTQELQQEQHKKETDELRKKLQKSAASVLQHTLGELKESRARVQELEKELSESPSSSTKPTTPILKEKKTISNGNDSPSSLSVSFAKLPFDYEQLKKSRSSPTRANLKKSKSSPIKPSRRIIDYYKEKNMC